MNNNEEEKTSSETLERSSQHRMPLAALSALQAKKIRLVKAPSNRKDVTKKIQLALEQYLPYYHSQREMTWSVPQLEQHFGRHGNDLFKWLKANLLIDVRSYSTFAARATTYRINQRGFDKVWFHAHRRTFDYATERARQVLPVFLPYLQSDDPLHMALPKVEGGRLYWAGQPTEKIVRKVILQGCWDYDIQSAMPTLVLQSVAASKGLDWREKFPTWARLLGNRKAFRESLAERLGISYQQAKEVCQGMFDLRVFTKGKKGISEIIGIEKTAAAQADQNLQALRAEALDAWSILGLEKDGAARFRYYEQVEQQVMQSIYEVVTDAGIRCLPFHDGFTLLDGRQVRDKSGLEALIQNRTGYSVMLEETRF